MLLFTCLHLLKEIDQFNRFLRKEVFLQFICENNVVLYVNSYMHAYACRKANSIISQMVFDAQQGMLVELILFIDGYYKRKSSLFASWLNLGCSQLRCGSLIHHLCVNLHIHLSMWN